MSSTEAAIRKYDTQLDGFDPLADQNGLIACATAPLGGSFTVQTLQTTLGGIANPNSSEYAGPPPNEIKGLLSTTESDASVRPQGGKCV